MDNAERLIAKAYEWIEQASHELSWDEGYTKTRKGKERTSVFDGLFGELFGRRVIYRRLLR